MSILFGFSLHSFRLFSVSVGLDFPHTAHTFLPESLSNHCQCLCSTFSEICTKFDPISLSDPSRNHTRPDIRLQIKRSKNQHIYPAAENIVHWHSICATTIIYCWIALLQLLYRWQHHFLKLWITLSDNSKIRVFQKQIAALQILLLWVVVPRSFVLGYRRFGETCFIHLQDWSL
jgi:hypothetical protein